MLLQEPTVSKTKKNPLFLKFLLNFYRSRFDYVGDLIFPQQNLNLKLNTRLAIKN